MEPGNEAEALTLDRRLSGSQVVQEPPEMHASTPTQICELAQAVYSEHARCEQSPMMTHATEQQVAFPAFHSLSSLRCGRLENKDSTVQIVHSPATL